MCRNNAPTVPQPGRTSRPFILPSNGRVAAPLPARTHVCAGLRSLAIDCDALHRGCSPPARRTNRSCSCRFLVDGNGAGGVGGSGTADSECAVVLLPGSLFDGIDLDGKSALDQTLACSANADVMSATGAPVPDEGSLAVSKISVLVSRGMSKFGASPFATEAATSVANLTSGRSQEPR